MKIIIRIKNVYGRELIYPVCEQAKRFALLCGSKTFTHADLEVIEQIGFGIEVEQVLRRQDSK